MAKRKLQRFAEMETFSNVFFLPYEVLVKGSEMKGRWQEQFFLNNNPIVLELGCGRGEYTIGLARAFPEKNFIGVDIKGARLWRGAKTALEESIANAAFIRTKIELIEQWFAPGEVSELWITFPDPQPRESKEKKRLTSPNFIERYRKILQPSSVLHLKTDSQLLFEYSEQIAKAMGFNIVAASNDLYNNIENIEKVPDMKEILKIKTVYEDLFTKKGFNICYLRYIIAS